MPSEKPNILFICSRNQWRSPTAVEIYKNDPRVNVRSAGLSPKSPHTINAKDIEWADLILVMENEHKTRIQKQFSRNTLPSIKSLDIPDEYQFMDTELVELLESSVELFI